MNSHYSHTTINHTIHSWRGRIVAVSGRPQREPIHTHSPIHLLNLVFSCNDLLSIMPIASLRFCNTRSTWTSAAPARPPAFPPQSAARWLGGLLWKSLARPRCRHAWCVWAWCYTVRSGALQNVCVCLLSFCFFFVLLFVWAVPLTDHFIFAGSPVSCT